MLPCGNERGLFIFRLLSWYQFVGTDLRTVRKRLDNGPPRTAVPTIARLASIPFTVIPSDSRGISLRCFDYIPLRSIPLNMTV